MSNVKLQMPNGNVTEAIEKLPYRSVLLPLCESESTFLGWREYDGEKPFMNFDEDKEALLHAVCTDRPAYVMETHYRGDVNDYVGKRCQYRRYVADIYLENAEASEGCFKIDVRCGFLYYIGYAPLDGITLEVTAPTTRFEGSNYATADDYRTSFAEVKWHSEKPLNAKNGRVKIARILFCFSRFGIGYSEIASRAAEDILSFTDGYTALAGKYAAKLSANLYIGTKPEQESSAEDFENFMLPESGIDDDGEPLSRFAVMSDSHIGSRYNWENYNWLQNTFDGIKTIHNEAPLDFVVSLGDNIDDGYAETYKLDYAEYLKKIKSLEICDPVNPIENRKAGTVPHYEMQGNHDTSFDTRFFRNKMWFTENENGERVYYIAFFTDYGGYPLIKYEISGSYDSYRSYGKISDETVSFVEKSMQTAAANNAVQIVLMCHFGIAKQLTAPILPETGLGKLALLCKKYNVKLYFNGHEHNSDYSLYNFNGIYDYDAAMTADRYAVVEIRRAAATVTIFNSADNTVYRNDELKL